MNFQDELINLQPDHEFFIGIDSDGCVFDSMEVKQKEFFIPNALKYFDLYSISKVLRETWEFVNLYSVSRGGNRFTSIIKVFELLDSRNEITNSDYKLPDLTSLKEWIKTENRLGNSTLRNYFESHYDPNLEKVLLWSEAVNNDISQWLRNIPPFPHALTAIKELAAISDIVVISQTPLEALLREWEEHDLMKYVKAIAGQEHGSKSEHIALAAKGKYPDKKILMIGDAAGDMQAAKENNILFFPVIPGKENESWERLINEGIKKFTTGEYAGNYEEHLLNEFRKSLPELPV